MKRARLKAFMRLSLCLLLLAGSLGSADATPYYSSSIKATVVNGATGRPLQGVVVLATWDTVRLGLFKEGFENSHRPVLCYIRVNLLTAESGKDGVFEIPGWGPKDGCVTMFAAQPELLLYKPGFRPLRLLNIDVDFDPTTNQKLLYMPDDGGATIVLQSHSRWDGKTIQLEPAGSHRTIPDPQIASASLYGLLLPSGNCFWKEERPAFLVAMEEERRLSTYGYNSRNVEQFIGGGSDSHWAAHFPGMAWCKPPDGYLENLVAEADLVAPEIRQPEFRAGSPEAAFELTRPDPWAMPAQDLPHAEDLVAGGAAQVAIIHHVDLQYPAKPYFARVYMSLPLDPKVISGYSPKDSNKPTFFEGTCAEFNAPIPPGQGVPFQQVSPPRVDEDGKVPAGYPVCYMLKVLGSPHDEVAKKFSNQDYFARRPTYDSVTRTYLITEQMLDRQQGVRVPEYIEIEAPAGAVITTNLQPTANPRRWLLPGFTRKVPTDLRQSPASRLAATNSGAPDWTAPFTLRVTMPEAGASEAAAQPVPVYMEGVPGFEEEMNPSPGEPSRSYQFGAPSASTRPQPPG